MRKLKKIIGVANLGVILSFILVFNISAVKAADSSLRLAGAFEITTSDITQDINDRININIPGLNFSKITGEVDSEGYLYIPWIGQYIGAIYRYAMIAASILAVVMIIIEGAKIIVSAGGEMKTSGYKRIGQIVVGLIILWGSYAIMYNINPDLVSFRALKIKFVQTIPLGDEGNDPLVRDALNNSDTRACYDTPTCQTLCAAPEKTWPSVVEGMVAPNKVNKIPNNITGIIANNYSVKPELIAALKTVGETADGKGYKIRIGSGYRPLFNQIKLVCEKVQQGNYAALGIRVAWPGGSRHGLGIAIDVALVKDGKILTMSNDLINELEEIMRTGGFVRYCAEWWHFELGTAGTKSRPPDLKSYCPRPYAGER